MFVRFLTSASVLSRSKPVCEYVLKDKVVSLFIPKRPVFGKFSPRRLIGIDYLKDPRLNKGLSFTWEERQMIGIHGILPPCLRTQEEQVAVQKQVLDRFKDPLNKYIFLMESCEANEKLFYKLVTEHIEELMPIIYTPTVGLACQKFGLIYNKSRGLFISINDAGHVANVIRNWPEPLVKAVVVTDGQRILGLGDLGAYGMGIPVGKLALYTALAGIKPEYCLPITLDVGTDNQTLLEDPLYIGLRQKRVTGQAYDDFIDEFMEAVVECFGHTTLIQFEDFGSQNAFRFLQKYKSKYCTFNDDIQGTASCVLSGLIASTRLTGKKLSDYKFVFLGAGGAALGIANLTVKALKREGISEEKAQEKIWLVDLHGLLTEGRPEGIAEQAAHFAKKHAPVKDLSSVVNEIKPSVLIGVSAASGAFTPEILKAMASFNERPVIFALSNPTPKAECTAEQAYVNTEGRAIFASGSPFGEVTLGNKKFRPGQGNNAYIFPGVALGIILSGMLRVNEKIFLIASDTVAKNVSEEDLAEGRVYPPLNKIMDCSVEIACNIIESAYKDHSATLYPQPKDIKEFVLSEMYNYEYESYLPITWAWPDSSKSVC